MIFVYDFIMSNLEMFFALIGITGTIYTICGYYKKHGYQLGYIKSSTVQLSVNNKLGKDVFITYKGKPIKQLQETSFRIFNNGDQPLRKEDLYGNAIEVITDGKILNTQLLVKDIKANVNLKVTNKHIDITFDYFNCEQLIEVKILHEGNVNIVCQAAGMSSIKEYDGQTLSFKDYATSIIYPILVCPLSIVGIYDLWDKQDKSVMHYIMLVLFLVISIFVFVAIIFTIVYHIYFTPKRWVSKYSFVEEA